MGADLLIAVCPAPPPDGFDDDTLGSLLTAIDELSDDKLFKTFENAFGFLDDDERVPDDLRMRLKRALHEVWEGSAGRRDLWYTESINGGGPVFLTGGMSWGDTPTDIFDDVGLLAESGIMERLTSNRTV